MTKFLDKVLSDNPQLEFQEIYEECIREFIFSSGNDSMIFFQNPDICKEQLENANLSIQSWTPDESGAMNINVYLEINDIYYVIPKTGKPKNIKKRLLKEKDIDSYVFANGKCYASDEDSQNGKSYSVVEMVTYESKFVKAFFYDGNFTRKVYSSDVIKTIHLKIFEPELIAFLNIKAIRAEYRVLSLQREIQALKSTVDNLIAVTSIPKNGLIGEQEKVEEVINDEHLDSNDENPFADLVDNSSANDESTKLDSEEHNLTGEYHPPRLGSMASVVDDVLKENTRKHIEQIRKENESEDLIEIGTESQENSEVSSEDDENVVAIVQMDCEGNITGVIPNPVQEEIDYVQKVEGSSL